MSSERQRAFAQAMITVLPPRVTPTRAQVEAALAELKVLSPKKLSPCEDVDGLLFLGN
jgi:hypothetical protein